MPNFLLAKLGFLKSFNVSFGVFLENVGDKNTLLFIMLGFILTLAFKNSIKILEKLDFSFKYLIFSAAIFSWAILSLNKISEFLYFNF